MEKSSITITMIWFSYGNLLNYHVTDNVINYHYTLFSQINTTKQKGL